MKILTVTTFFPNPTEPHRTIFVKNLVMAMREYCAVIVVAPVSFFPPISKLRNWFTKEKIPTREFYDGLEVLHPRFLAIPKANWWLGLGYFLGIVRQIYRLKQQHDACVIHVHCAFPDAVGVALVARVLRLPYIVTAHGSDINVYANRQLLGPQIRWALCGASGVIAVSRELSEKILKLTNGKIKHLVCIPCAGFQPDMFYVRNSADCRATLGLSNETKVVVFVGNLVAIKSVETLIDAWAALAAGGEITERDLLVIVGDGPSRADLNQRVQSVGLTQCVRFTGTIPQSDVSNWIAASNVLCLPSRNEGTPNVVVEALASGVPVVATRVGGVPDLVRDGENGYLVNPGLPLMLANALGEALTRTWNKLEIQDSVSHLTWRELANRNCEFLESVAHNTDPASAK